MKSKWLVLSFSTVVALALIGTLSVAQDDELTPIQAHMEKVQKQQGVILKYWAKRKNSTKEETIKASQELVILSQGIGQFGKEEAEKEGEPIEKWNELTEGGVKAIKGFADFMKSEKADDTKAAREAYKSVTAACNACHDVFNK